MLSALDLARRIDAGELSPADVIDRCAEAVAANESTVGAFAALDLDGARQRARRDAAALAAMPLRGLPVGVKDIFDTTDFPTEYGSPIYAGHRAAADATLVADIRKSGGLVLGKTVTTEFAFLHPGRTRNPRNLEHTPGGSSSGSAAAVAAGMLPIALGSQTGGSTIRPAAFCGVAGFKPSFGLLPTAGMKGMAAQLDTVGLIAAGVADVAFAISAIGGRDLRVDGVAEGAPRIALMRTHLWQEASTAMQAATEAAWRAAEDAGAQILELTLPPICEEAHRIHSTIQSYQGWRAMTFEYNNHREQLSPVLRKTIEAGAAVTSEAYDDALRIAAQARGALADLMAGTDVLLTPSAPGAAPNGLSSIGISPFNRLWTLLGVPCVNVPGLEDEAGMPLGVQVIAPFGHDREALLAAHFVERAVARRAG
jgi:Asp-tRNA(Asn)/Glu-tRNA(Gln) amidotransferase A subunit family amidase